MNVFIRQPFTQSSEEDRNRIQSLMDVLAHLGEKHSLAFLTPLEAQSSESFKTYFEQQNDLPFTPQNFRRYRLELVDRADAFIILRTGLSESGAFEIAYNLFGRKQPPAPLFFAIWDQAQIKTTLLRELDDLCHVEYVTFNVASDLQTPLDSFFQHCRQKKVNQL